MESKNSFRGVKSDKQKEKTTDISGSSFCRLSRKGQRGVYMSLCLAFSKSLSLLSMSLLLVSQTTYSENRPVGAQKRGLHPHVSFSVSSASSEIFRVSGLVDSNMLRNFHMSLFLAPWKPFSGRSCPKRRYMTDMSKVRVQITTHLFFCLFGEDSSNIRSAGLNPGHVLTACALHGSYITQTSKLAVGVSMPRVFFSA